MERERERARKLNAVFGSERFESFANGKAGSDDADEMKTHIFPVG
jgi:hypothetical protein